MTIITTIIYAKRKEYILIKTKINKEIKNRPEIKNTPKIIKIKELKNKNITEV